MKTVIRFHTEGAQSGSLRDVNVDEWWPKVEPATREWIVATNGDEIPADVVDQLIRAGRSAPTGQLGDDEID